MIGKQLEIREHAAGVYHLQFYNNLLYSSSADRFLTRWNLLLGTQDKFAIQFDQSVYSFLIHRDILLAGTSSGELYFFDLSERKELRKFTNHTYAIFSIALDETNDRCFVGDADGMLTVWRWSDQKFLAELPMACGKIRSLAIHQGKLFLGGADGFVYVLETDKLNVLDKFYAHNDGVTSICVHDEALYTGGKDAYIRKWDLRTYEKVNAIPAHNFAVYKLLSWNNELISVSRDKTIKAFSSALKPVQRIGAKEGGHSHSVNSACIIDKDHFATCGDDRRIIIWKMNLSDEADPDKK